MNSETPAHLPVPKDRGPVQAAQAKLDVAKVVDQDKLDVDPVKAVGQVRAVRLKLDAVLVKAVLAKEAKCSGVQVKVDQDLVVNVKVVAPVKAVGQVRAVRGKLDVAPAQVDQDKQVNARVADRDLEVNARVADQAKAVRVKLDVDPVKADQAKEVNVVPAKEANVKVVADQL